MKKYMSKFICIVAFFSLLTVVSAQEFEFVTVSDVVRKVKDRFSDVEGYSANFVIESKKGSSTEVKKGTIQSLKPNMLKIQFRSPKSQLLVSDGETMWIHIPSMNVVAEQDLKGDKSTEFSTTSYVGLKRLFAKYHYKFDSKDQPALGVDGKKYYTLYLKQKESRSGYKSMKLWVNEDFLITRAVGETSSGKSVSISFSNINTKASLRKGSFKFDIPANARVIKNPMIAEE